MLKYFDEIPGDNRSQIGFITYDETLHFYNLDSELSQPSMLVVSDIDGWTNQNQSLSTHIYNITKPFNQSPNYTFW